MEPRERDRCRERPLPGSPRAHLAGDTDDEPATVQSLLAAGLARLECCTGEGARERRMAFELLAADVRVTRACQQVLREGGDAATLEAIAVRIAKLSRRTGEDAAS